MGVEMGKGLNMEFMGCTVIIGQGCQSWSGETQVSCKKKPEHIPTEHLLNELEH